MNHFKETSIVKLIEILRISGWFDNQDSARNIVLFVNLLVN